MRRMIRRDDKIRVIRDVRLPFVFGAQQTLVQRALGQVNGLIPNRAHKFRNANLVFLFRLQSQPRALSPRRL